MNELSFKVRRLFLPGLGIILSYVIIYSFLHWYSQIFMRTLDWNEDVFLVFLPFLLCWIPILVWVRPRLKLLNLRSHRRDGPFNYLLALSFIMAVPTIIAQQILIDATGGLTKLNVVSLITVSNATRHYTIKQYYPARKLTQFRFSSGTSGKYAGTLHYYLHFAIPLYDNQRNTYPYDTSAVKITPVNAAELEEAIPGDALITRKPAAWLCDFYETSFSNKTSEQEKDLRWKMFQQNAVDNFKKRRFDAVTYFKAIGINKRRDAFVATISENNANWAGLPLLEPNYTHYSDRFGNKIEWLTVSLVVGIGIWLAMIHFAKLKPRAFEREAT